MSVQTTAPAAWGVHKVKQREFVQSGNAWAAVAPGCPVGPHPHRDCQCQIFPTVEAARAYIEEVSS